VLLFCAKKTLSRARIKRQSEMPMGSIHQVTKHHPKKFTEKASTKKPYYKYQNVQESIVQKT